VSAFPANLPTLQGRPRVAPDILLPRNLCQVVGYIVGVTRLGWKLFPEAIGIAHVEKSLFLAHNLIKAQPRQGPESTMTCKIAPAQVYWEKHQVN